jgi:hypothetical protein
MTAAANPPSIFAKLNLRDHGEILVINAPESFQAALKDLKGVRICSRLSEAKKVTFSLAFASKQAELDRLSKAIVARRSAM